MTFPLFLKGVAHIEKPKDFAGKAETVSQFLEEIKKWHVQNKIDAPDAHRQVWYRGHSDDAYALWPGVYKERFTTASSTIYGEDAEEKRLNLERVMLNEFRISGATLLDANEIFWVYFIAQHYGMPTRLLDWTTNPLAALFFAAKGKNESKNGEIVIMHAPDVLPGRTDPNIPRGISTMRHPYVQDAIRPSFWHEPNVKGRLAPVLPITPDNRVGRIGQQSSCFTLHMHRAEPQTNPTLSRVGIPRAAKVLILDELRKLNINEFTIYNDLDHLALEIKQNWHTV